MMWKEKIKKVFNKQEQVEGKKKIENLVVFIIVLIITIVAINFIWTDDKNQTSQSQESNNTTSYYKQLATDENRKFGKR